MPATIAWRAPQGSLVACREADDRRTRAVGAENHPGGFRAPAIRGAGEADDFTGPDVEAHIADLAAGRKMLDRQRARRSAFRDRPVIQFALRERG